jgi:hypothetical protein
MFIIVQRQKELGVKGYANYEGMLAEEKPDINEQGCSLYLLGSLVFCLLSLRFIWLPKMVMVKPAPIIKSVPGSGVGDGDSFSSLVEPNRITNSLSLPFDKARFMMRLESKFLSLIG